MHPIKSDFRKLAERLVVTGGTVSLLLLGGCAKKITRDIGPWPPDSPKPDLTLDRYKNKTVLRYAADKDGVILKNENGEQLYSGSVSPPLLLKGENGEDVYRAIYSVFEHPVTQDNVVSVKQIYFSPTLEDARKVELHLAEVRKEEKRKIAEKEQLRKKQEELARAEEQKYTEKKQRLSSLWADAQGLFGKMLKRPISARGLHTSKNTPDQ